MGVFNFKKIFLVNPNSFVFFLHLEIFLYYFML